MLIAAAISSLVLSFFALLLLVRTAPMLNDDGTFGAQAARAKTVDKTAQNGRVIRPNAHAVNR